MSMVTMRGSVRAKRVSSSQRRREMQRATLAGVQATRLLMAVLAQKGGEVEVTTGTMGEVMARFDSLGIDVLKSPTADNVFLIRLLETKGDPTTEPMSLDMTVQTAPGVIPPVIITGA